MRIWIKKEKTQKYIYWLCGSNIYIKVICRLYIFYLHYYRLFIDAYNSNAF